MNKLHVFLLGKRKPRVPGYRKKVLGKCILSVLVIHFFPLATFGDTLTLDESISEALENSPFIMVAREKILEAEAEKGKALSNFFPKIYASSSYTALDEEISWSLPTGSVTIVDDEMYDYNLAFVQPLFTGGGITSLYRMQTKNFEASKNHFEKVRNDLIFEVKKFYFKVLETEKLGKVAEEAVNQVGAHLEVVENFFREGMVPEVDVLKARVTLANAKQNLINANNGAKLAKSYFNNLLNRNMGMEVNLEDILSFEEMNFDLSSLIEEAFDNRPEIEEMKDRLSMAEEGIKIARSNFFPQVVFEGSWDRSKGAEFPVDEWDESWTAVVQVSMDIWDWGENRNESKKAKANLGQLKSSFQLLRNSIELEVRQAYLDLLAAKEKIGVQEEATKEAEKNSQDTSLRFKEGMATNTDVLDAQTLLLQVRSDYYRALYDYNLSLAALERAVGK